jgi:flagellar basal-body rod protein FlgB
MDSFNRNLDLLHRAMNTENLRYSVYADNLANKGVPHFKRTEVNFESSLKKAVLSQTHRPEFIMNRSNPRHISNWTQLDYRDVQPRRVLDFTGTYDNNGNNVDPEKEMNNVLKSQMRYSMYARSAKFAFDQVSLVLRA